MSHPSRGHMRRTGACFAAALSVPLVVLGSTAAWSQTRVTKETVREQNLSAQSVASHHYNSPAERAEDDLLIVKVKAAIANEGLADDNPLTVDADHGHVTLTRVLPSRDDVKRAVSLVSHIDGVTGVNNRLTWEKDSAMR
jgi:osmotically-inducible protein OsmY